MFGKTTKEPVRIENAFPGIVTQEELDQTQGKEGGYDLALDPAGSSAYVIVPDRRLTTPAPRRPPVVKYSSRNHR